MRARIGDAAAWGETEHLLAEVVDSVNFQSYQFAVVHHDPEKPKPSPPARLHRPGTKRAAKPTGKTMRPGELARMMARQAKRDRKGGER